VDGCLQATCIEYEEKLRSLQPRCATALQTRKLFQRYSRLTTLEFQTLFITASRHAPGFTCADARKRRNHYNELAIVCKQASASPSQTSEAPVIHPSLNDDAVASPPKKKNGAANAKRRVYMRPFAVVRSALQPNLLADEARVEKEGVVSHLGVGLVTRHLRQKL
jgi:hypothetical protein